MQRNRYLFVIGVFSDQKKTSMFENADLYRTNWRKRYFDALSCYLSDIRPSGEPESILATNYI